MSEQKKLKIVVISAFYSEGMGYSENCLSRALARRGHDVHVITSTYNVYGNEPLYDHTYRDFLGPRQVEPGTRVIDGYHVHRMDAELFGGYVRIKGIPDKIAELKPDIVHSLEIASLETFVAASRRPFGGFKLFTETHQCMSVVRPYMRNPDGQLLKRAVYRATRTLPTFLASLAVEKCYAVTPDCGEVAMRFYGVPEQKIKYLSLGADTEVFHPVETDADRAERRATRARYGFADGDVVCVYTGRFSPGKNPIILAKAIDALNRKNPKFKALFIGDGAQKAEIAACRGVTMAPFMTHKELAKHYRAADIAIWPREESMSMLDAASSGVPLIVSDTMGEPERAKGGKMYRENDVESLMQVIESLDDEAERRRLGGIGRAKMLQSFSWTNFAQEVESDFLAACNGR